MQNDVWRLKSWLRFCVKTLTTAKSAALLALLALIAWGATLRIGFIWDDHYTIEANPLIRGWAVAQVHAGFQKGLFNDQRGHDFYRPLVTWVSRIDYSLYGLRPWGYHLSNLIFHVCSTLLLWLLILRLGFSPLTALLTAAFFAVHPTNVQDMVMVTGRCGLLSMLFTLLALLLLAGEGTGSGLGGGVAYGLGLLSKESACMVVPLFLAISWLMRRPPAAIAKRSVVLLAISALYVLCRPAHVAFLPPEFSFGAWGLFMIYVFPQVLLSYAAHVLVPVLLYTDRGLSVLPVGGFFVTVALVLGGGWLATRRARWPFFCVLWVVTALLPPTILMVTRSLTYDHWAYPALPGFLLPIAIGLEHGLNATTRRWALAAKFCTGFLLVGWTGLAIWHTHLRRTEESFYRWSARFSASDTMRKNLETLTDNARKT